MRTMSRDATSNTAAHETTSVRTTLGPGMTGRHVHHRGVEIIVTTYVCYKGRVQYQAKKEAAIVATTKLRAISTTIAAIEDWKSDTNEYRVEATAVTSAKLQFISRLRGESR